MCDESVSEPRHPAEVRISSLEEQVIDINQNAILLMAALRNKLGIFGEEWGLNAKVKSEGGLGDWEDADNQPKKKPRKDQLSSSFMNQDLFKVEEKFDIKPYHDKIDALKMNH